MHLLNLSLVEFSAMLGATVAIVTALYLLDRSRKRRVVSTLRFWSEVPQSTQASNSARVEQPWSLLLQLLALTLLLLAVAGLAWNVSARPPHANVLILDASSSTAHTLQDEKRLAKQYLERLNPSDSVMLIEASGLVVPRTGFTTSRGETERSLDAIRTLDTALALDRALGAAQQARTFAREAPGEVVYIGPARVAEASVVSLQGLRFVRVNAPEQGAYISAMSAHAGAAPGSWTASVQIRNDGLTASFIRLRTSFGATDFAPRDFTLPAGATRRQDYDFRVTAAGTLKAWVDVGGRTAALSLPRNGPVRVVAYTTRLTQFKPLLASDPRLSVRFAAPSAYNAAAGDADLIVLDQFAPATVPAEPSLWLDPPAVGGPIPVSGHATDVAVDHWTQDARLGLGLQSHDVRLRLAHLFVPGDGDIAIASTAGGAVAVADPSAHVVVLGFDPLSGAPRLGVAAPLLIANSLRWLLPEAFSNTDASCGQVGTNAVDLPEQSRERAVTVSTASGQRVPFVRRGTAVEFYVDQPSEIHVAAGEWERKLSLTLPEVASADWRPAGAIETDLPSGYARLTSNADLWRALSIAAAILLLLDWILFGRKSRPLAFTLRAAVGLALVAAWFAPAMNVAGAKTAAVVLVDTSRPISAPALTALTQKLQQLSHARGRNKLVVAPFADKQESGVRLSSIAGTRAAEADLEGALSTSLAAAPDGYRPRILLVSDGHESHGSAARAIAELKRVHVPVDTVPLTTGSPDRVSVVSLIAPQTAYAGELVPLTLTVNAPQPTVATLRIQADGKTLGEQQIDLNRGRNLIHSEARVNASGAIAVSATVESREVGTASLDAVVQFTRARIVYYSQDLPGTEENLLAVMKNAGFEVDTDVHTLDGDLTGNQIVILNNTDLNVLATSQKLALSNFVEGGGGLLLIGGEHQVYKEDKQLDALDRVLPAKLAPPRDPEGICVGLIIDKSSSMEGRKIDLARLSAIGVVDHLTPRDSIGVLMFDNSYEWAVPMRKAVDKETIKTLISGITPDGGTQIAPALGEAYRRVLRSDSAYKHIVLLTDGISEEGDSLELASEALAHHVTISTVGLGQDVNRSYLERIALLSGGKSYFLNNPQGLQQILLKDVQDYTGSTTVEKPLTPAVKRKAELLDGVDMEQAPPLKGYARFEAKPDAETLLTIDSDKHDPLFVRWQYGLGRAAIFTSDAKSRWAEAWMTWPGFDKFWTNVLRDLATRNNQTDASARVDAADDTLHVRYELPVATKPGKMPDFFVLGPHGFGRALKLNETSPGIYEGRTGIGKQTGVFRIRPLSASALFPEIGLNRQDADAGVVVDEQLLRSIAEQTGGRYDPPLSSVFDGGGSASSVAIPLWPGLLCVAVVLDLCELILRRRRGLGRLLRFRGRTLNWRRLVWTS